MDALEDLYLLVLGGDGARLVVLAGLASLLVSSTRRPWMLALLAFTLDRAWPLIGFAQSYGKRATGEAVLAGLAALPGDLPALGLRFLCAFIVVSLGWHLRLALHGRRVVASDAKA